jgi:hypothetical protein
MHCIAYFYIILRTPTTRRKVIAAFLPPQSVNHNGLEYHIFFLTVRNHIFSTTRPLFAEDSSNLTAKTGASDPQCRLIPGMRNQKREEHNDEKISISWAAYSHLLSDFTGNGVNCEYVCWRWYRW